MHNLLRIQALNCGIDALRELGLVNESGWNVHEPIISRSAASRRAISRRAFADASGSRGNAHQPRSQAFTAMGKRSIGAGEAGELGSEDAADPAFLLFPSST